MVDFIKSKYTKKRQPFLAAIFRFEESIHYLR